MKKIKYTLFAVALGAIVSSCNDLDLAPIDYYASGNFWKNEAHIVGAINGHHNNFRGNIANFWIIGEMRGGTFVTNASSSSGQSISNNSLKLQNITAANPQNSNWFNFYGNIFNLNDAIVNINKADYLSEGKRNYYLGQVHGLRAWYYFMLYRTYGGVPIKKGIEIMEKTPENPADLYTARSTPKETLDFIKSEINASEKYFHNSNNYSTFDKGLWSYYATLMLKAEIYLWSAKVVTGDQMPAPSDLNVARASLDRVINSNRFSLLPNFESVFSFSNKKNNEIIFSVSYAENEASTPYESTMYNIPLFSGKYDEEGNSLTSDPLNLKGGSTHNEYKFELFELFDAQDTRRATTFYSFYSNPSKTSGRGVAMIKYMGTINSEGNRIWASDVPIYRYADAILMYAEIVNKEGGDPSPYINQIRQRAYGASYNASYAHTHTSFADSELAILKERDKEFVAENKRWFDVRRMQSASGDPLVFSAEVNYGSVVPILDKATEEYKLLWPVNVGVLTNDKLVKQTPGYED